MPATPDDPNATRTSPPESHRAACAEATADLTAVAHAGTPAPSPVLVIPGFEIVAELGRGAMGVVYDARQIRLNRRVALKVVQNPSAGPLAFLRFLAEAEVVAAVRHPNVIQVYESGQHAGVPYLAMECLTGGTLGERLRAGGPLSPRNAAALVAKIAGGVGAAHDLGIVHRDLKPGNVLFDSTAEPKVADFGLAKRQAVDLTHTGALMGTPAYMAPEQAGRRTKFVGPPADVWALGVILYECLTGRRPFEGESTAEVLTRIVNEEPTRVRTYRGEVPRDLETVIGKCLAKEPERRYATAGELADDLERFVRGEPITARPVGRFERALLWTRRKPAVAAAYGLSALAVLLGAVLLVIAGFWRTAEAAKQDAESARDQLAKEKQDTEKARDEAVRLRGVADDALRGEQAAKAEVEREREQVLHVNYGRTLQLALETTRAKQYSDVDDLLRITPDRLRDWEYDYIRTLLPNVRQTATAWSSLSPVVWSPDRRWVLCHSKENGLEIRDAGSGRGLTWLQNAQRPFDPRATPAWSPDNSAVVISGGLVAWVRDTGMGQALSRLEGHTARITSVAWSPDGSRVLTASEDHSARVWDPFSGRFLRELKGHAQPLLLANWSPDGSRVLTVWANGMARVWDAANGKTVAEFTDPAGWPETAESAPDGIRPPWGPDGTRVVSNNGVRAAWSPDGTRVAINSRDSTVRVWNAATGEVTATLKGHKSPIRSVSWNPRGTRIATESRDDAARVWDPATGNAVAVLRASVGSVAWSPNGSRIVSVGGKERILVWDPETGTESLVLDGSLDAHFSPDGARIYTWCNDPKVYDAGKDKPYLAVGFHVAPMPRSLDR